MSDDAIEDALRATAAGPARIHQDDTDVVQQPLQDLIAADRYLAGKTAAGTANRGLRFNKLVPPGTVGRCP